MLLHQTASSSRMFERLMGLLAQEFQLIAFDTPGFGASAAIPGSPWISDYVDVLREGARELRLGTYHLLGHHTGAAIATQWAAEHATEALSLTTVGALAMGATERDRWLSGVAATPIEATGAHFGAAWERVAAIDVAPVAYPPTPVLRHREAVDLLLATPGWDAAYRAVFSHDYEAAIDRVTCPILIVSGEGDILHRYFESTRARRPDATALKVAGGAYVLDQCPETIVGPLKEHLLGASVARADIDHAATIERSEQ